MPHGINTTALIQERQKLRKALTAMDDLLRALDVDVAALDGDVFGKISLATAIRAVVVEMRDGITKEGVIERLHSSFPQVKANPQSVASALVKMTQENDNILYLYERGSGSKPSIYTTFPTLSVKLEPQEMDLLFAPERAQGSGGWQSLFKRLQGQADRSTNEIILTEKMVNDIQRYYVSFGHGGWQDALKAIFGEKLPYLFQPLFDTENEAGILGPDLGPRAG